MVELIDLLHNIHHYTHQHLMLMSVRLKAHYNFLADSTGVQKDGRVWHNLDKEEDVRIPSWEDPYRTVTQINK
jgi:hypothetical protein